VSERARERLDSAEETRRAAEREAEEIRSHARARAAELTEAARRELETARTTREVAEREAAETLAKASREAADALRVVWAELDEVSELRSAAVQETQGRVTLGLRAVAESERVAESLPDFTKHWKELLEMAQMQVETATEVSERAQRESADVRARAAEEASRTLDEARRELEAVQSLRAMAERVVAASTVTTEGLAAASAHAQPASSAVGPDTPPAGKLHGGHAPAG
jgi:hypothetical protein